MLLLDASPDIRYQLDRVPDAIALTHGHMGHYSGLIHLGKESANTSGIPLFCTERMARFLADNEPWATLTRNHLVVHTGLHHDWHGIRVDLIPVPHRSELTDAAGISLDGRLLYLPDIDSWDEWPEASRVIDHHEVALLDASLWKDDELANRDQGDVRHPPALDTIRRFEALPTRVVLTHLNHTNPLCDPASPETATVEAAGFEVAFDGMTFQLED